MPSTKAALEARLDLLETAFFGPEEEDCGCEFCTSSPFDETSLEGPVSGPISAAFTKVVLDGAEEAIERLTAIAEDGTDTEALEASNLLLQYGLALVDRGRV